MAVLFLIGGIILALSLRFITRAGRQADRVTNKPQYEAITDFLSPAERSFFGVLQQAAGSDFIVFAKVRLADIVRPVKNPGRSGWRSAFNCICGKHVDFILCDPASMYVLLAI